MAENLYVGSHKGTNKKFRDGWDRTFKSPKPPPMVTNYCTVEDHMHLHNYGYSTCPRCGEPTDPKVRANIA